MLSSPRRVSLVLGALACRFAWAVRSTVLDSRTWEDAENEEDTGLSCFGDGGWNGAVDEVFSCGDEPGKSACEVGDFSTKQRKRGNVRWCRQEVVRKTCSCGRGKRWCVNAGSRLESGTCSACNAAGTIEILEGTCKCRDGFPGPACKCSKDRDCPSGRVCATNGECMTPCEKSNFEIPRKLPINRCFSSKEELLSDLAAWCTERPTLPHKLQGFFWMKDLNLPYMGFCMSGGLWSKGKRSKGKLVVGDNASVYVDDTDGWKVASKFALKENIHTIKFLDDQHSLASLSVRGMGGLKTFLQDLSNEEGLRWAVPTFGLGGMLLGRQGMEKRRSTLEADPYGAILHATQGAQGMPASEAKKKLQQIETSIQKKYRAKEYQEAWKIYEPGGVAAEAQEEEQEYVSFGGSDETAQLGANVHVFLTTAEPVDRYFRRLDPSEYENMVLDRRGWPVPQTRGE